MAKKIYILLGHPDKETLSGHFADIYEQEAKAAGHEVRRTNIGDLSFDPILHKGYKVIQELEPDLLKVQEDMRWAEHLVACGLSFLLVYVGKVPGQRLFIRMPKKDVYLFSHSALRNRALPGTSS